MIQEISKTIKLLFQTLGFGTKVVVEELKPYAKLYIKGLLLLTFIAIVSPIPFLIIGIIGDWKWLIALTGIWWALWTFLLLLMALPIGILVESLTGGIKGSGQRYIKLVTGILLVELCISLFAAIIPVKANLSMFPLLIVAAIILGLLNAWLFSRKIVTSLVSVIFIALLLSFFFPTAFEILGEKISDINISMIEPKQLYITYEDIGKRRIKFFGPHGEPKVWYYRTEDGRYEFFNRKGQHPITYEKLEAVTPNVVPEIVKQLKTDAERMAWEEQKKREEAEKIAKQKESQRLLKQKRKPIEELATKTEIERVKTTMPKVIAKDDFESGTLEGGTGWIGPWEGVGYASVKPSREAKQGSYVAIIWGKREGSYIMRSVDLSPVVKPRLQFYAKPDRLWIDALSSENADYAVVQISQDKEKWYPVATWVAKDYVGGSEPYRFVDFDLSPYAGVSQFWIKVIVVYKSMQMLGDYPMLYIDDLKIIDVSSTAMPVP
jgi:hypothetical protein